MSQPKKKENPLVSIVFNIALPILILQKVGKYFGDSGPLVALILALALPLGYGLWDYIRNRHKNYVALLGVINVLLTGGFALAHLEGIWFAVKEAAFPALMALGVGLSAFSKKPFLSVIFMNEQVMNLKRIEDELAQRGRQGEFLRLIRQGTVLLSLSFVFSAILNYYLARVIFTDLDPGLSELVRSERINEQIAKMTGYGYLVIALPMMIFLGGVMIWFLRSLARITGLKLEDMMHS